jgi:hypothetical protein
MKPFSIVFLLWIPIFVGNPVISMQGIKIADSEQVVNNISLDVVAFEEKKGAKYFKYRTENGNDFTLTIEKGKVVYLENDWLQDKSGNKPLITNFVFGETTLKDIRAAFGTNGFAYTEYAFLSLEKDLITFNCFELDSPNDEILVIATKIPFSTTGLTEGNVAENFKLEAVILSNKKYLNKIWGKEKAYDGNFKKIKL